MTGIDYGPMTSGAGEHLAAVARLSQLVAAMNSAMMRPSSGPFCSWTK